MPEQHRAVVPRDQYTKYLLPPSARTAIKGGIKLITVVSWLVFFINLGIGGWLLFSAARDPSWFPPLQQAVSDWLKLNWLQAAWAFLSQWIDPKGIVNNLVSSGLGGIFGSVLVKLLGKPKAA